MVDNNELNIMLARPSNWRPFVDEMLGANNPASVLARGILSSLHDRHIGITPKLALDLATCMQSNDATKYPEPWQSVRFRLQETLFELAGISKTEAERLPVGTFRLYFNASISYTVFHIALPLVEKACRQIKTSILFAEDDDIEAILWSGYPRYEKEISAKIKAFAESKEVTLPSLFWQERALVLDGLARTREKAHSRNENRIRPAVNPLDLGLLLRLDPEMNESQDFPKQDLLPYHQPDMYARRLPDAGTDGVHITHRLEDIHRRVLTEWLYPELIQLDHLLNEGFLATRRPPQPIRLRDILIVGILPRNFNAHTTGGPGRLIKSCWSDFILRVGPLLQRSGLDRSELRWIEGNEAGRFLTWSMLVNELPDSLSMESGKDEQRQRQRARIFGGWLQHYLDSHVFFQSPGGTPNENSQDVNQAFTLETWLSQMWRSQKDNQAWHKQGNQNGTEPRLSAQDLEGIFSDYPLDTGQYVYTHVMLFLSENQISGNGMENNDNIAYWKRLFSLKSYRNSLSLTTVPDRVMAVSKWMFCGSYHSNKPLVDTDRTISISELAGELETRWIRNIIEDLRNG